MSPDAFTAVMGSTRRGVAHIRDPNNPLYVHDPAEVPAAVAEVMDEIGIEEDLAPRSYRYCVLAFTALANANVATAHGSRWLDDERLDPRDAVSFLLERGFRRAVLAAGDNSLEVLRVFGDGGKWDCKTPAEQQEECQSSLVLRLCRRWES